MVCCTRYLVPGLEEEELMARIILIVCMLLLSGVEALAVAHKEVDIRGYRSDSETFYIIFAGRGISRNGPTGTSVTGHAFVVWRDKPTAGPTVLRDRAFGLYPVSEGALYGPGTLKEDQDNLADAEDSVSVRVDKRQWDRTEATRATYQSSPPYMVSANDCMNFVMDIGKSLGLVMPNRGPIETPDEYIEELSKDIDKDYDFDFGDGNSYHGQSMVRGPRDVMHLWPYGKGVYHSGTGTDIAGDFRYGFVEGDGSYKMADGHTFEGRFKGGYPVEGTWRQGGDFYTGPKTGLNGPGSRSQVKIGWSNGDHYEGGLDDHGALDGPGSLYKAGSGLTFVSERSHGQYTKDTQVLFPNGGRGVVHLTSPGPSLSGTMTYTGPNGSTGSGNFTPTGYSITTQSGHPVNSGGRPESHGGDVDHPRNTDRGDHGIQLGNGPVDHFTIDPHVH
jgi:hypothetical protein